MKKKTVEDRLDYHWKKFEEFDNSDSQNRYRKQRLKNYRVRSHELLIQRVNKLLEEFREKVDKYFN